MKAVYIVLLTVFSFNAFAATLEVGDPAPKLKIEKWIQGEPVKKFEKGRIYLVEFWGTWCGPCIAGIPHLNEIAREYAKDVTVISVAGREIGATSEEKLEKLTDFMRGENPKIEYAVAFDGTEAMNQTWLKAAEVRGIPSAFVIDRDGKIAFIGHPILLDHEGTGHPLKKIIAGTWLTSEEGKKFLADEKEGKRKDRAYSDLMKKYEEAEKAGDWQRAHNIALEGAKMEGYHGSQFEALLAQLYVEQLDEPAKALVLLFARMEESWNSVQALGFHLNLLAHDKMPPLMRDLVLGDKLARRIVELIDENPDARMREKLQSYRWLLLPPVAKWNFVKGMPTLAVEVQQAALATLPEGQVDDRAELERDLAKYKSSLSDTPQRVKPEPNLICKDGVCELPEPAAPVADDCEKKLGE